MKTQDSQTYAIIGAAMEVHKQLGNGFLEAVYQEALEIEFAEQNIPYQREADLAICYKGNPLKTGYRADFICYDSVIVELKALTKITGIEESQIINYLKASDMTIGLILNFGTASLGYYRFANSRPKSMKSAQSADSDREGTHE